MRPLVAGVVGAALTAVIAVGITVVAMVLAWPGCEGPNDLEPVVPAPTPSDPYRPVYHYTPAKNWVNDPNGLLYYKGEYHLFYQYDANSTMHEEMSWGHAVSTDLVHWQELPLAIPANDDEQIFSGCLVVDENCTSNLCNPADTPVLVAVYTSWKKQADHIQSQHIASSTDLGRTWTKFQGNPVLDENALEFRDPKVIWMEQTSEWLMLVQQSTLHYLMFYKSTNLKDWTRVGQFPAEGEQAGSTAGVWECPDMFWLPLDGDPNNMKAVLIVNINPGNPNGGSAGQYFVGHFNGTAFVNESPSTETKWLDYGMDYYAAITWANVPENKRISIGWMANWEYTQQTPNLTWRNSFSVPRELKLKTVRGKPTLTQLPVTTLDTLRQGPVIQGDRKTIQGGDYDGDVRITGRAVDIQVKFVNQDGDNTQEFGVRVHAGENQQTLIGYDVRKKQVFIDRTKSGDVSFNDIFPGRHSADLPLTNNALSLRILVDHSSVEVFAGDNGEVAITDIVFPNEGGNRINFYAQNGTVLIEEYSIWKMKPFRVL